MKKTKPNTSLCLHETFVILWAWITGRCIQKFQADQIESCSLQNLLIWPVVQTKFDKSKPNGKQCDNKILNLNATFLPNVFVHFV